jgi:hypothetical protein
MRPLKVWAFQRGKCAQRGAALAQSARTDVCAGAQSRVSARIAGNRRKPGKRSSFARAPGAGRFTYNRLTSYMRPSPSASAMSAAPRPAPPAGTIFYISPPGPLVYLLFMFGAILLVVGVLFEVVTGMTASGDAAVWDAALLAVAFMAAYAWCFKRAMLPRVRLALSTEGMVHLGMMRMTGVRWERLAGYGVTRQMGTLEVLELRLKPGKAAGPAQLRIAVTHLTPPPADLLARIEAATGLAPDIDRASIGRGS